MNAQESKDTGTLEGPERIRPELGTVQQTLLLPLLGRVEFSRRPDFPFTDEQAETILEQLEFDRSKARRSMGEAGMMAMAVRALKMDRAIREFTQRFPDAAVVNIGAGLDTAFWRVDNGRIRWFDLDLPDSLDLRRRILPPSGRNSFLERSMFDLAWIDEIGDTSRGVFIQIPGVLPYIDKDTVMKFFAQAAPRLKGAEVVFDAVSPFSSRMVNLSVLLSGMKGTRMDWGLLNAREMLAWTPHVEIVSQEGYFEGIPRRGKLSPATVALMHLNDWWKVGQLFHVRFV